MPPLGEPLAEMVREVEVRDHVELDDAAEVEYYDARLNLEEGQ